MALLDRAGELGEGDDGDAELAGEEDKADEYRQWTVDGIEGLNKIFRNALKESVKLRTETKITRGKKTKKLLRLRGK